MDLIKIKSERIIVAAKHFGEKASVYSVCNMIRSIARRKDEKDKTVEGLECGNA